MKTFSELFLKISITYSLEWTDRILRESNANELLCTSIPLYILSGLIRNRFDKIKTMQTISFGNSFQS